MKHKYLNSIQEVVTDGITVGFIARRSVIIGIDQHTPDGWMITKSVVKPFWIGGYKNRKDAREVLEKLYNGNKI